MSRPAGAPAPLGAPAPPPQGRLGNLGNMHPTRLILVVGLLGPWASAQSTLLVPEQYASIPSAVQAASDGDTISVAPGTYAGTIQFLGKRVLLQSRAGHSVTALTGGGGRVLEFVAGETRDTIVDGFTIRDGGTRSSGGGILIQNASPTIRNCHVRDNSAWLDAGGLYSTGGAPLIQNCVFSNNTVDFDAPGIWIRNVAGGTAVVLNCTVTRNRSWAGDWLGALTIGSNTLVVNTISRFNLGSADIDYTTYGGGLQYSCFGFVGSSPGPGNIDADPRFVHPTNDFRLQADSPCRDTGTATPPPITGGLLGLDLDAFPRILGAAPDMGAYEYRLGSFYCFGDGSGAACPCANSGRRFHGCRNDTAEGGLL